MQWVCLCAWMIISVCMCILLCLDKPVYLSLCIQVINHCACACAGSCVCVCCIMLQMYQYTCRYVMRSLVIVLVHRHEPDCVCVCVCFILLWIQNRYTYHCAIRSMLLIHSPKIIQASPRTPSLQHARMNFKMSFPVCCMLQLEYTMTIFCSAFPCPPITILVSVLSMVICYCTVTVLVGTFTRFVIIIIIVICHYCEALQAQS